MPCRVVGWSHLTRCPRPRPYPLRKSRHPRAGTLCAAAAHASRATQADTLRCLGVGGKPWLPLKDGARARVVHHTTLDCAIRLPPPSATTATHWRRLVPCHDDQSTPRYGLILFHPFPDPPEPPDRRSLVDRAALCTGDCIAGSGKCLRA
jgi:hypothetical protein